MIESPWTIEAEAIVRRLWAKGVSTAKIAAHLNASISDSFNRSSVLGKARRLKLGTHKLAQKPGSHMDQLQRAERQEAARRRAAKATQPKPQRTPPSPPADILVRIARSYVKPTGGAWDAAPGTIPVPMSALEPGMCKWPIGDGSPFLFCGAHADHGSYCEHHHLWSVGRGTRWERGAVTDAIKADQRDCRVVREAA